MTKDNINWDESLNKHTKMLIEEYEGERKDILIRLIQKCFNKDQRGRAAEEYGRNIHLYKTDVELDNFDYKLGTVFLFLQELIQPTNFIEVVFRS